MPGRPANHGLVSGSRATFVGDGMATIVQGVDEVRRLLGEPPVVVGGLAVLSRLSTPYRATLDLDVVDRLSGEVSHLEVLRASDGAEAVEPASVLLQIPTGAVKVDVLEVRQIELDQPSDDPGDRLHASAHAWAWDTATDVTIEVVRSTDDSVEVSTPIAEPGPLIAMKLQAVMNRMAAKQGTDLLDIVRLALDQATRPAALAQIGNADRSIAADIATHVDYWLVGRRVHVLRWVRAAGGDNVTGEDIDLVAELLLAACERR